MHKNIIILIGIILSIGKTYAQDTVLRIAQVKENVSPIVLARDEFYQSPALRPYYRMQNYSLLGTTLENTNSDLYIRQYGSGRKALTVSSESFLKNLTNTTLWGKAYYINEQTKKVNYNETLDYHYVYPYVMADTVGGDLTSETYYFGGGLSKKIGGYRYAIQGSFKGIQSYRDKDPRPKNISADIEVALSVAKELTKRYSISVDGTLQKYNQNNSLQFVNELGFPLVYHDAGLGMYNELLAGTRLQAYYKGLRLGGQLNITPVNLTGFSGQLGLNKFNLGKELSSVEAKIADVNENNFHALIGYHALLNRHSFLVKIKGMYRKREGTEAKFTNTGVGSSTTKISEEVRYEHEQTAIKLNILYGIKGSNSDWHLGLESTFNSDRENYIAPNRFINYQSLSFGGLATFIKPIKETIINVELRAMQLHILNSDYSWGGLNTGRGIYHMLTDNYNYVSSNALNLSTSVRVDYPFSKKLNVFVKGTGSHIQYKQQQTGNAVLLSAGVVF